MTPSSTPPRALLASSFALALALGCAGSHDDPAVAKPAKKEIDLASIPVPPADGPRIAAIAPVVAVVDKPAKDAKTLGYLRAGATLARSKDPVTSEGCPGGWFAVRPRGLVCAGDTATLNLSHPSLAAMKTPPKLDAPLPYSYVRATAATRLFEWDRGKGAVVREAGKLRRWSGLAVIGSWDAMSPEGKMLHLSLLPDGHFVAASDTRPAEPSAFKGVDLGADARLPVSFVVKHGVRKWHLDGETAEKKNLLEPMTAVPLTGKFRTVGGEIYWATADGKYVRHKDMTVVRKRDAYPDFASGDQKWIDVSVVTGTLVAYEGKKAVFATLVCPGQDRFGDPKSTASTQLGTHSIAGKQITTSKPGTKPFSDETDLQDVPWALELSSGQMMHGAYWHDRFGVEYGPGNLQVAPSDAARLFAWADPQLPEGWHGVGAAEGDKKTIVLVRK
jgi:hypothetical protein